MPFLDSRCTPEQKGISWFLLLVGTGDKRTSRNWACEMRDREHPLQISGLGGILEEGFELNI